MADRTRLVDRLRYERDARIDHALFYWTQVFMAYNSNHMEGSTLTPEQTRQIYDTGRLLADADEQIRLDDAIETRNHFTAFNYVIDHADDPVDAGYVCRLHALLKRGTSQDGDPGFNVGGYKTRDNAIVQRMGVAMVRTVPAGDVPGMMERVYAAYAGLSDDPVRIAMCHWMFERVHPFSDGNGRVGRLVMFKECLRLDTVPPSGARRKPEHVRARPGRVSRTAGMARGHAARRTRLVPVLVHRDPRARGRPLFLRGRMVGGGILRRAGRGRGLRARRRIARGVRRRPGRGRGSVRLVLRRRASDDPRRTIGG